MAALQKETGAAKGRGFGSVDGVPSFMNRFKTWIVKTPGSGGPGWYIIDDQSTAFTDPYIVVSDQAAPSNTNRAKIMRFMVPTGVGDTIYVDNYLGWNTTTHVGISNCGAWSLSTNEAVEYEYQFRGGPECMLIQTRVSGVWRWVMVDEWEGNVNLVEALTAEGVAASGYIIETGDTNNQISGYSALTGIGPHLDAAGKLYFTVVSAGGASQIFIYKDSARTQLIGQTANSGTVGTANVTAQNGSGVGGSVTRSAVGPTGTNAGIEVDFTVTLNAGQGANFTAGKFYYVIDPVNGHRGAYFKVRAIVGDKLIPESINNTFWDAGALVSAYPLRYSMWGSTNRSNQTSGLQIPYYSIQHPTSSTFCISAPNSNNKTAGWEHLNEVLRRMDPDDEGAYAVIRPLVYEWVDQDGNSVSGYNNRAYGQQKNIYIGSSTGITQMQDGRTVNSKNYIGFHDLSSGVYAFFLDTTSLS